LQNLLQILLQCCILCQILPCSILSCCELGQFGNLSNIIDDDRNFWKHGFTI